MNAADAWSPDEPQSTETFEAGDEAAAEAERLDPSLAEGYEQDPSLSPVGNIDELEAEEAGIVFDDPETMATLPGGGDDPDGIGGPPPSRP